MEFTDVVTNRRSIRKFKPAVVDKKLVKEGILMATKAPSAHNRQPWKFMIVSDEQKNIIANVLEEKTKNIPGHTGGHTANIIREVPCLVAVFIDNQISENRDMDMLSIGAAIQNMILTYTSMGLGTIWIGNTNLINEELKEILDVGFESVSCIGIGEQDQFPHERPRKDISEVIIKEC